MLIDSYNIFILYIFILMFMSIYYMLILQLKALQVPPHLNSNIT